MIAFIERRFFSDKSTENLQVRLSVCVCVCVGWPITVSIDQTCGGVQLPLSAHRTPVYVAVAGSCQRFSLWLEIEIEVAGETAHVRWTSRTNNEAQQ